MSNRRKPLIAERNVVIALAVTIRLIVATAGSVLASIFILRRFYEKKDPEDILSPKLKTHPLIVLYQELSKDSNGDDLPFEVIQFLFSMITIAPVIGFTHEAFRIVFTYLGGGSYPGGNFPPSPFAEVFFPHLVMLILLFLLNRGVMFGAKFAEEFSPHEETEKAKQHYITLFRNGTESLVHEEWKNTTYTIRLPHGTEWNAERSIRCIEQLLYSFKPLLFRISADHQAIVWEIVDVRGRDPEAIKHAIRTSYPEADVRVGKAVDCEPIEVSRLYRLTLVYRAVNQFVFPLKYASEVQGLDPLTAITNAMNGLREHERMSFNLFVVGDHTDAHAVGERLIRTSTIRPLDFLSINGIRTVAALKSWGLDTVEKYVPRDQKVLEEKLRHPLYQAVFMVQVDSPDKDRLLPLAQNLDSQMYGFSRSPYNSLCWYTGILEGFWSLFSSPVPPDPKTLIVKLTEDDNPLKGSVIERIWKYAEDMQEMKARKATRLILGGEELGLLWHVPDDAFAASRIKWLSSRTVPPPSSVVHQPNRSAVHLGDGTSGGQLFPIQIPTKDRENHIRIMGKTGVGKSTLMYHMIVQDILQGYGVAVIDPHGSLIQQIIETQFPEDILERFVILDLADRRTPPPLNPLRGGVGHVRVGQIVQSIERIYPATRQYPRLSYYLRAALLTLNGDPQATVKDVVRLFTDSAYREGLVKLLNDAELRSAWEEFDRMKDGEKRTIVEPIRTRISPFYTNPDLTHIMCHPDSLDFRQLIKDRKIILVSLKMDEERVPETERDLIGALLLSRLQMSGMFEHGDTPYFVYIDEVQRFVTSSLDSMFAEARKFGLSLTVAHQFLDQLPDATQNAIIGNAGASIIFGCSPKDAQVFAPYTTPYFDRDDIVNLDQFTAVVKMQCDGTTQPAFTLLSPLPYRLSKEQIEQIPVFRGRAELDPALTPYEDYLSPKQRQVYARGVQGLSRENYTPKTRTEIAAWLKERYGHTVKVDNQSQFFDE